jgi:hypothetical protein
MPKEKETPVRSTVKDTDPAPNTTFRRFEPEVDAMKLPDDERAKRTQFAPLKGKDEK